jgi:RNA polymerase sigma factor (TIGR02999 family)
MEPQDFSEAPGFELSQQELDYLFSLTYEELRRLASIVRRGERSQTLNTTALVNEAWLKLAKSPRFASTSILHFKRVAARAMRQLLIEAARRRMAGKRGPAMTPVSLDVAARDVAADESDNDLVKLDLALEELAQLNPRQALMIEARFFGGLDITESAELLGVSEVTIVRDWRAAKAWLAHRLRNMK